MDPCERRVPGQMASPRTNTADPSSWAGVRFHSGGKADPAPPMAPTLGSLQSGVALRATPPANAIKPSSSDCQGRQGVGNTWVWSPSWPRLSLACETESKVSASCFQPSLLKCIMNAIWAGMCMHALPAAPACPRRMQLLEDLRVTPLHQKQFGYDT